MQLLLFPATTLQLLRPGRQKQVFPQASCELGNPSSSLFYRALIAQDQSPRSFFRPAVTGYSNSELRAYSIQRNGTDVNSQALLFNRRSHLRNELHLPFMATRRGLKLSKNDHAAEYSKYEPCELLRRSELYHNIRYEYRDC